jgi:hypothetical protein
MRGIKLGVAILSALVGMIVAAWNARRKPTASDGGVGSGIPGNRGDDPGTTASPTGPVIGAIPNRKEDSAAPEGGRPSSWPPSAVRFPGTQYLLRPSGGICFW